MSYRANYAPDVPSPSSGNLFSFLTCLRTLTHYGRIALLTKNITMSWWTPQLNAVLGTVVVTIGGGLLWGSLPVWWNVILFCGVLSFLLWRGHTIGAVWAWSTLLLGIESLAWPIVTMVHVRLTTNQPSDEDMGLILNAVLFGLFSSVFWISFAYGLFKRKSAAAVNVTDRMPVVQDVKPPGTGKKTRRS